MTTTSSTPLWTPSAQRIAEANITRFSSFLAEKTGQKFPDYQALHEFSVREKSVFWQAIADVCEMQFHQPAQQVLIDEDKMPGAKWFVGSTLNFAEHLLRFAHKTPDAKAITSIAENGETKTLTFTELYFQVAQVQQQLKALNIQMGDRIAAVMPNCVETTIAMLATTSLGAIWSSCSPDFGVQGILDRFSQIEPKLIIACEDYAYNGKIFDVREKIGSVLEKLSESTKVLWKSEIPPINKIPPNPPFSKAGIDMVFTPTAFDHPLYIMFSSGTTGKPKCIVHSVGGTLIQHLKELSLHTDLKAGDSFFYFTTCGWMMWNWFMSGLALGAHLILYDGSPFYPESTRLINLIDEYHIAVFGAGARYYAALEKAGCFPKNTHQLKYLKTILSTGSPLSAQSFQYLYEQVKTDVCVSSISGGTDIVSCFSLGNPCLPVYSEQLQCLGLGMDVAIFDEAGQAIQQQKGELVCRSPFPSMPIYFWQDEIGEKYQKAYFSRFKNIWAHGDYGEITAENGLIIYGRSDAVLNPGGVRIGTAEIYAPVETFNEVLESIAIGQQWQDDVRVILFLKLRPEINLDDDLIQRIKQKIRQQASPRHVPAKIIQVPDLPKTISGKLVELAVTHIIHGQPVNNVEALANPEALKYFEKIPALQTD